MKRIYKSKCPKCGKTSNVAKRDYDALADLNEGYFEADGHLKRICRRCFKKMED